MSECNSLHFKKRLKFCIENKLYVKSYEPGFITLFNDLNKFTLIVKGCKQNKRG